MFEITHDVLDHHDRVVDDKTDRNRQTHERQVVEAVPERVHHAEGRHQRERHHRAGNNRRPEIAQKQKDDHHHEADGQRQRQLDVIDQFANVLGAVRDEVDVDRGGKGRLQQRDLRLDLIDHVECIGAGLTPHQQEFGRPAVEPGAGPGVGRGINGAADVPDAYGRPIAVGHDHIRERSGIEQLIVGIERHRLVLTFEIALGLFEGRRRQRVANIFEADAAGCERGRIDLRMHRILLLAGDVDLRHPGNLRDPLRHDRVGVVVDPVERKRIGRNGIDQDRTVGRVGFPVGRRVRQIFRQ